jgi:uncharacterized protein (TIGR02217 family)
MSSEIFPSLAGLEYPVVRTPVWKTLAQTAVSGNENRVGLWTYPRWQWTLSFNFLRDDANNEFRTLAGFFLARQGSYDSFLFNDADDNAVTAQPLGIGNGTQTDFQFVRSFGGFTEPVLSPLSGFIDIYVNGALTTSWSLLPAGIVQFATAPAAAAVITASFAYLWPVRFLADQYDFSKTLNRIWEQKKLDLISLKNWP